MCNLFIEIRSYVILLSVSYVWYKYTCRYLFYKIVLLYFIS